MRLLALIALFAATACREDMVGALPDPVTMSADALGHYCQMNIAEHEGPKAQIHLAGFPDPIFFGQVRDAIAYLYEPEKVAPITAIYVSNMSRAESWAMPGADNWIAAGDAHFVVGSDARGGMGAPELVPFETAEDALAWTNDHGGKVSQLNAIPPEAVLGAIERGPARVSVEEQS